MLSTRQPATTRRGFTLIELIVVIAIIAILMALTTAGVMKFMGRGTDLKARSEIEQLQADVSQFENKMGVDYIPSRIILREDIGMYNTNNQLELDSVTYLKRLFGPNLGTSGLIDWNGDGTVNSANAFTLSGDQCLVFFLGGIPNAPASPIPACQGFSRSTRNPAQAGGERNGPYFQFDSKRLQRGANGFFSYRDPYDRNVYAYFSSYGRDNGYYRYGNSDNGPPPNPYLVSGTMPPSAGSNNKYQNPKSFQIISAGKDGSFGPGGVWGQSAPATGVGDDDMTNFHPRKMGAP